MSEMHLSIALLLSVSSANSTPDQTGDARLLLTFVDAVKRGEYKVAEAMLTPRAFVGDYTQSKATSFAEFANYARACQLRRLDVVTGVGKRRMPMGVKWSCPYPEGERDASFWFDGERISRIGWGKPLVIKILPAKTR